MLITVDDSAAYSGVLPDDYWYSGNYSMSFNNTTSEFGHLFYTELGNKGYVNTSNIYQPDYGLTNKGPFANLQSDWYWSGTEYSTISGVIWFFYTNFGLQVTSYSNGSMLGLAVRNATVEEVAQVPEPSTILLLGGGIAGLAFWRRRKSA